MVGQIIFLGLAAICLFASGFVGGLSWSARECGAGEHCAAGLMTCAGLAAIGVACLIAGAIS